jgi:HAD superfamily hydrolase (TIGR01509 family)
LADRDRVTALLSAVIFDLDGTLVQTESLKAESYARAASELRPGVVDPLAVIAAYDQCIGLPRDEVAQKLLDRFGLADAAASYEHPLGVSSPRDAFVALRVKIYEAMISDHDLIARQELPFATALVRHLKAAGYPTALTTVSHAAQALVVLDALKLRDSFDVIVTIDDVSRGKPDPEIYLLAARRLSMRPAQCLAIEDSMPGVQSAVAAGMTCVASTNPLTRASVHAAAPLPGVLIVDDPQKLESVVRALLTKPEVAGVWS